MGIKRVRTPAAAAFVLAGLALAACSSGSDTSKDDQSSGSPSAVEGDGCYVHLFDADDFDESDDNFKLTEPGRYEDLSGLPDAGQDWTDEADSVRVGSGATVKIWSKTNFEGEATTLDPGSEHPTLDPEPLSLELTC